MTSLWTISFNSVNCINIGSVLTVDDPAIRATMQQSNETCWGGELYAHSKTKLLFFLWVNFNADWIIRTAHNSL